MGSSANSKFYYVVVMEKYKTIMQKQCMDVKSANALLVETKVKYPSPQYIVTREWF